MRLLRVLPLALLLAAPVSLAALPACDPAGGAACSWDMDDDGAPDAYAACLAGSGAASGCFAGTKDAGAGVVVADLDGDGAPDLVAAGVANGGTAFHLDGTRSHDDGRVAGAAAGLAIGDPAVHDKLATADANASAAPDALQAAQGASLKLGVANGGVETAGHGDARPATGEAGFDGSQSGGAPGPDGALIPLFGEQSVKAKVVHAQASTSVGVGPAGAACVVDGAATGCA